MTFWEVLKMTLPSPTIGMAAVMLVGFRKEIGGGMRKAWRGLAKWLQRPSVFRRYADSPSRAYRPEE